MAYKPSNKLVTNREVNKLNLYFCYTKDEYEDNTGATSLLCALVSTTTANKAKYMAHKSYKGLHYSFEYIDWRAELVAKDVDIPEWVLSDTNKAWDDYFCPTCGHPYKQTKQWTYCRNCKEE